MACREAYSTKLKQYYSELFCLVEMLSVQLFGQELAELITLYIISRSLLINPLTSQQGSHNIAHSYLNAKGNYGNKYFKIASSVAKFQSKR